MLLGRDRIVAGAVASIHERGVRRLVLIGRAGVGKTAVAVAVAERLTAEPVLVPLDGADDEQEVLVRIGRLLEVTEAGKGIRSAIVDRLGAQRAVVILDGCDGWDPVAPIVDELLDRSDEVILLITTRAAPAGVDDEAVVHLHPLPVPEPYEPSEDALRESPAVRLFVERAQQVSPAFHPAVDDLRTIGELCRRLDGLPLAVKLAASRISLMQPDAMLREMGRVGPWNLVGLSLEDEFARSIEHLDEGGRRTFVALDAFVGGASVDALHEVSGLPELADTIDSLSDLVDLDLVTVDRARARYSLASVASSFLRDRGPCTDPPPHERRARHAAHFARLARERSHRAGDRDLAIDHGNRLAAVSWFRETGDHDRALRLLVDMAPDFDRRGEPDTGRHLLAAALANAAGAAPRTRAEGHVWVARFVAESLEPVDRRLAVDHLLAARSLAEESGHEPIVLAVLLSICENHTLLGSFDLADDAIADGLGRTEGGQHPVAEVGFLTWKAVTIHQRGDDAGAAAVIAEAIGKAVALADRRLLVRSCLVFLGLPADVRGSVVTDSPSAHELIELARADGDHRAEGWLLSLATGNAIDEGDRVRAAAACRELLDVSLRRANAPLGRLGLAAVVRLAAGTDSEELAARITGALDRHGPAIEASIAPHTYASYRDAVSSVDQSLGDAYRRLHDRGRLDEWDDLTTAADDFLGGIVDGSERDTASDTPIGLLSPRELDVLSELVAGRSNKEIAATIGMRPKTVMHHCAAIYRKLGVTGRAGAVGVALRNGFPPR